MDYELYGHIIGIYREKGGRWGREKRENGEREQGECVMKPR